MGVGKTRTAIFLSLLSYTSSMPFTVLSPGDIAVNKIGTVPMSWNSSLVRRN